MSGLDHLGISAADYETSLRFYEQALAPLGIKVMMQFDDEGGKIAGLGSDTPFFWIGTGGAMQGRLHFALVASRRADVDAFYQAALAAGGKDNGAPGVRPHYHANYYAAFVLDPDGNNIEAVCHGTE